MNKTKPPGDTSRLPNPAIFLLGSPESRAAARIRAEAQGQGIDALVIEGWPKNSRLIQDAEGRYRRIFEEPVEGSEKPIGETTFEGRLYEVYGSLLKPTLFPKHGTEPLPTIRLPRAKLILHISCVV